MTDLTDATLDELRAELIAEIAANAAFDGWGPLAIDARRRHRAASIPMSRRWPSTGRPVDMIDAWFATSTARWSTTVRPNAWRR